jgi:hypothetical protein
MPGVPSVALLFTASAVVLAWLTFRLERGASRQRDRAAALAVLRAVQQGIVEGLPGQRGWGEFYFATIYDSRETQRRALETRGMVEKHGWDQVFVVPTAPLELLATSNHGGLISEETVFAANLALWRVEIFNQLVQQQAMFNAVHAPEILDRNTTGDRLTILGIVAGNLSQGIHADGIGRANAEGGWYDRLKKAVAADVERLGEAAQEPWWRSEPRLLVGDLVVLLLVAIAAAAVIVAAATPDRPAKSPSQAQHSTATPARSR